MSMHGADVHLKPRSEGEQILNWLITKLRTIGIITAVLFLAFLVFLVMHWWNSGSVIVDSLKKEIWQEEPVKVKLGNIRVGLRIMPSANTENNILVMNYVRNSPQEDQMKNVDKSYHLVSDTKTYFPTLTLKEEYVPFGEPEPY